MPLTYVSKLSLMYEFGHCTASEKAACDEFLASNGVNYDNRWWCWLTASLLFVAFRLAAYAVLRKKVNPSST